LRSIGAECSKEKYPLLWKQYNNGVCLETYESVDAVLARDEDRVKALKQAGAFDLNVASYD
jgi:hypothetical protein